MSLDRDALFLLAWTQLWQVTLVAVVLGMVARRLGRRRPHLAYTLWMLILLKALVPPVWSCPTGIFSWAQRLHAPIAPQEQTTLTGPVSAASLTAPDVRSGRSGLPPTQSTEDVAAPSAGEFVWVVIAVVWSLGIAASFCFIVGKWFVALRLLRSCQAAGSTLVQRTAELARTLGVRRAVRLLVTERPFGPAVHGAIRPTVLLPQTLVSQLEPEVLEMILAHELVHIRRRDVLASRFQLAAQQLWWFHPLVWWANREASRVRERCCDQEVVRRLGCTPVRYARSLLTVLEWKQPDRLRPIFSLPGMRPADITAFRLEHIMRHSAHQRRFGLVLCRLTFVLGAILLLPGAGLPLQEPKIDVVEASAEDPFNFPVEELDQTKSLEVFAMSSEVGHSPDTPSKERNDEPVLLSRSTTAQAPMKPATGKNSDQTPDLAETDADRTELEMARDRVKWAEEMHRKGYVSDGQVAEERLKLETIKIRQAQERLLKAERVQDQGHGTSVHVKRLREVTRELEAMKAQTEFTRAKERLEWAQRMFEKGYVSSAQKASEQLNYQKAKLALKQARDALALMKSAIALAGVVKDRQTSKPISRVQVSESESGAITTVDEAGLFSLGGLAPRSRYSLVALPLAGQPYLITSKVVEPAERKTVGPIELELTRGIPFRIRVVDESTNKPIPGALNYFPVSPNDPFESGVMGYAAGGPSAGAFYEAVPDGHTGEYYGAVLAGPGILCFTRSDGKGRVKRGDSEPAMFYPDGKEGVSMIRDPTNKTSLSALVPVSMDPKLHYALLGLWQYDAVVAVNPRPGTREVAHEIRLEPGGR
jgi:beta-lactamase regulating signal transducer with metallopeptidase domain